MGIDLAPLRTMIEGWIADAYALGYREGVEACELWLWRNHRMITVPGEMKLALLPGQDTFRVEYDAATVDPTPTDAPHLKSFSSSGSMLNVKCDDYILPGSWRVEPTVISEGGRDGSYERT